MRLKPHQLSDLEFHLSRDRSMNLSECSTGKTPTMCRVMLMRNLIDGCKTVWIMPSGLMKQNKIAAMNWCDWNDNEVVIVKGDKKKRLEIYKRKEVKCFIITADTFGNEWELILENEPEVNQVVIDESHQAIASHTSKRTQSIYRASRKIRYWLFCTATIISGRFSSAYPAIAICEPRFYLNYQNFLNYHAVYGPMNRIVGWGRGEKLKTVLRKLGVRHTIKECYPDNPPFIYQFETAEIDENLKQNYITLEREALIELEDSNINCDNPAVKAMKARILLSCPETMDLELKPLENGKDNLLKVHLENAKIDGSRLLIFSCFLGEQLRVKKLCEDMGVKAEIMNGTVSQIKRGEIAERFKNNEFQVCIMSVAVGSCGYNFEFCKEVIWLSMDYQDSSFEQGNMRISRGTRKDPARVFILSYNTKLEKRILDIVRRKMKEKIEVFGLTDES